MDAYDASQLGVTARTHSARGTRRLHIRPSRRLVTASAIAAVAAAALVTLAGGGASSGPASTAQILERYGRLPLRFEVAPAAGPRSADYVARGHGFALSLRPDRAALALTAGAGGGRDATIRMAILGADSTVAPVAGRRLPGVSNYLLGSDTRRWRTGVPGHASVTYPRVLPGIDLVYHGRQRALEYDFVLAPGAEAERIGLRFAGVESTRIDRRGNLVLGTDAGRLRQAAPVAYQTAADGTRQTVQARYVRRADGGIGFAVGAYDRHRKLVIDPLLSYATFLGGAGSDTANAVAVDASGKAYVAGSTSSAGATGFPTQAPFQGSFGGGTSDAFVAKLSASGTALEYSTYIGGGGADVARGIAVEGENAYITGDTTSRLTTAFPTTPGAFQTALAGDPLATAVADAFVTKLSTSGASLAYSTYLGGAAADRGRAIAVAGGVAHVTGDTASSGATVATTPAFPTQAAVQGTYGGGTSDAFLTKVNATGSALDSSTFLGGSLVDQGNGVAVAGGKAYVAGQTTSTNFPTQSPMQAASGGSTDAFVARYNAAASALEYSTYLGGSGVDRAFGVAVATDDAFVAGDTDSADFPTTAPLQAALAGETDAFVTRLAADGASRVYSTYVGGVSGDGAAAIALDGTSAVIVGFTSSASLTATAAVAEKSGNGDAFVTKLSATGAARVYSTFLGGSSSESGNGVAVDASGSAYVVGSSVFFANGDFPTRDAFQPQPGIGTDAFAAKIAPTPTTPLVTGLRPHGGSTAGGTPVVINGTGFGVVTGVSFGGVPAPSFTVDSGTKITAISPAGTGKVTVTVTSDGATTPANPAGDFSYGEGSWAPAGTLNVVRYVHTMTLLKNGKVLAAGGRASQGGASRATAETYDPLTNSWTVTTGPMTDSRFGHSATLLDGPACQGTSPPAYCGKVLIAGGFTGNSTANAQQVLATAELFDPATSTFTPTGTMANRRALHAATLLPSGKVLVAGGRWCNPPTTPTACDSTFTTATSEVYDPAAGTWTPTATPMTADRHTTAAAVLANGKVLVPAGFPGGQDTADLYDPATNSWTATAGRLAFGRARGGATLLPDGRVLIAAGFPNNDTAEIYNPATDSFSSTGKLTTFGRFDSYFALLPNGRVLMAGGGNGGLSVELYDPPSNTWRRGASSAVAHGSSSSNANSLEAIVLTGGPSVCATRCGQALVAGNTDDLDAELYVPAPLPVAPPPPPPAATPPPRPPPAATRDTVAPVISGLRVSPSTFSVGGSRPRGTTFRYRLSEAARVTFTIERASGGRRVGGTCRRPASANRARPLCTRYTRVGRVTHNGRKGTNRRAFSGRIAGRALARGRYRVVAIARDSAGNVSKRRTARFRIKR